MHPSIAGKRINTQSIFESLRYQDKKERAMKKSFVLEQIRRLHLDYEMEEHNDEYWKAHYDGHLICKKRLEDYLEKNEFDRSKMRKFLNKLIRTSEAAMDELDRKYHYFMEEKVQLSAEDEKIYAEHDGLVCFALSIKDVINKKEYFSKN